MARFTRAAAPHLLESRLRPRLLRLTAPRLLALPLAILGLVIDLPIPFGNTLPGLTVLVIALGFGARDGAGVLLGLVAGLVGVAAPVALLALGFQLVATPVGAG